MKDKQHVQGDQFVLINEVDAKKRNINNGDKLEGFMSKDYIHGTGKLTYNNGLIYSGDFAFNVIEGSGSLHGTSKNLIFKKEKFYAFN